MKNILINISAALIMASAATLISIQLSQKRINAYKVQASALEQRIDSLEIKLLTDSITLFQANIDNVPGRVKEKIYYTRNGHKWRMVYSYDERGRITNIKNYEQDDWKFSGNGWGLIHEYKYTYQGNKVTIKIEDWSQMVLTGSTTTYITE